MIVLTSSKREIAKSVKKLQKWQPYYMSTWSIDEIEYALFNSLYSSISIDDAKELFELCGGISYYIFEWKKKITIDKMEDAVRTLDSTFQQYKVQFASFIIRERIYQKFLNEQEFSLHNFLKTYEDESVAGGICGNLFDEFSHKMLKGDGKYEIRARRRKSAKKKLNLAVEHLLL
ncbi:5799_t:CDS:2 [Entrophospora sp. SA101]|nr:5218_t:CDS:2 [Entrophospora sp. SA101]CAJ0638850.1 11060_t:CDS:2 [Entrophospora sp. SA101]CAJ0764575.1 6988_t:CDS:2 [Entrophospora sp. SA101]CAJ0765314.1 5799_t:CDS:2 [Entrophospora sp. SA101]CAJ0830260.1 3607_t:CDS:2 [Entrophospora sp. SA101]